MLVVSPGRRLLVGFLLLAAVGCSSKPPLVPASGKVESGGKPVAGATVEFIPDAAKNIQGRAAVGQSGDDGSFQLQTPPHGAGASPGIYRITVTPAFGKKASYPAKYTRMDKTTLVLEIPQGGKTDIVLKLD